MRLVERGTLVDLPPAQFCASQKRIIIDSFRNLKVRARMGMKPSAFDIGN
jgi:hypothetical protein